MPPDGELASAQPKYSTTRKRTNTFIRDGKPKQAASIFSTISGMEKEFVDWLRLNFRSGDERIVLGPGDDAAILNPRDAELVVSTDSIADGVHFETARHQLADIGHKAMAVNLSDLAAMGARPFVATVNLFCPHDLKLPQVKQLYAAMSSTALRYGTTIVGGDTNRWHGPLQISATILGTPWPGEGDGFWRMDTGKPGDWIVVSGRFGGSLSGKHLNFEPRVELAREIRNRCQVHAATDVTDSLAMDLSQLAHQSHCGFIIQQERIPVSPAAAKLAGTSGLTPLDHALYDGEDFELIFCIPPEQAPQLVDDWKDDTPLTHIGYLTDDASCLMQATDGQPQELEIRGYVH